MASFSLGVIGSAVGGPVGGFIGGVIGSVIDSIIFAPDPVVNEGPRLGDLRRQADSPGAPIARVWGPQNRVGTALVWTSGLKETRHEEEVKGGKGLDDPKAVIVSYTYSVDVAILVGRAGAGGAVTAVRRIWANSKLLYDNGSYGRASDIRVALGTLTQQPDAMLEAAEGAGNVPAWRGFCVVYIQALQLADFGNGPVAFEVEVDAGSANLQGMAGDLCGLAGIPAADINARNLPMTAVPGFAVKRLTSAKDALSALGLVHQFDLTDTGYQVKFRRRQRAEDGLIHEEDFAAGPPGADPEPPEAFTRESERQLPTEVVLTFSDYARNLQVNSVRSDRLTSGAQRERVVEFPGTLTPEAARNALDDLHADTWQTARSLEVTLPAKYLALDAGDIVRVRRAASVHWDRYVAARVTIGADWRVEAELRPLIRQWAVRTAPSTSGVIAGAAIPITSDSAALLLDLPVLVETEPDENGFKAAASDAGGGNEWLGASLYRAPDGVNYSLAARFGFEATHGVAATALADGPFWYPDRANTVDVTLSFGLLASIAEDAWLGTVDQNAALLGAELIQFRDATLVSGTTWRLSGLKRGRRGTEWATAGHAIGETFVLLESPRVKRVAQDLAYLNKQISYRMPTTDQAVLDAAEVLFTNTGIWAKPLAGLRAAGARDGSSNLTITWSRRDRRRFSSWFGSPPMSEASEAYEVDIMNGATVVRTIATTTESASYSAADQTTDFGSPQASVVVNIYQLSDLVGRGYALNGTV